MKGRDILPRAIVEAAYEITLKAIENKYIPVTYPEEDQIVQSTNAAKNVAAFYNELVNTLNMTK